MDKRMKYRFIEEVFCFLFINKCSLTFEEKFRRIRVENNELSQKLIIKKE